MAPSRANQRRSENDRSMSKKGLAPIVRSLNSGFPQRLATTLRYTYTAVVSVTGTPSVTFWGFNSPNQPGRTLDTAAEPLYYSQLAVIYDNCYTTRSRAKASVQNLTVADGILVILSHDNDGTTSSSSTALREKPFAHTGHLGHYQGGSTSYAGSIAFEPQRFLGFGPSDVRNTAVQSQDPDDIYTFVVSVRSLGGGTGNIAVTVDVEYDVVLSQIRDP